LHIGQNIRIRDKSLWTAVRILLMRHHHRGAWQLIERLGLLLLLLQTLNYILLSRWTLLLLDRFLLLRRQINYLLLLLIVLNLLGELASWWDCLLMSDDRLRRLGLVLLRYIRIGLLLSYQRRIRVV
jgi:hypothetical protein